MTRYDVAIARRALAEIEITMAFLAKSSTATSDRWYSRLRSAIESLQEHPERCPLAPEAEWYEGELRELVIGNKRQVHRILFEVRDQTVHILRIRHASQNLLGLDEV